MKTNKNLNIKAYLIIGPENTLNRPINDIVKVAIESGFTTIQIRSKKSSAREIIKIAKIVSDIIKKMKKEREVSLIINDRLDIVLAAKDLGIKIDGIHVGQKDIPVEICRKYLGEEAIIGLSPKKEDILEYIRKVDITNVDYFGIGPINKSKTKPDSGIDANGKFIKRTHEDIKKIVQISPIPIVVGGGVKSEDIPQLARTGADGFFVISAVTESKDPKKVAKQLVDLWDSNKK